MALATGGGGGGCVVQARELTLGPETPLATAALLVGSRQARFHPACARRKGSCAGAGSGCSGAAVETCCSVSWEIVSANAACRALGCGCAGGGFGSGPFMPCTGCGSVG